MTTRVMALHTWRKGTILLAGLGLAVIPVLGGSVPARAFTVRSVVPSVPHAYTGFGSAAAVPVGPL